MKAIYISLAFLSLSAGCHDNSELPDLAPSQTFAIPETVFLGDQYLVLRTELYRSSAYGQTYGYCYVSSTDSTSLPPSLVIDGIWIVDQDSVWKSGLQQMRPWNPPIRVGPRPSSQGRRAFKPRPPSIGARFEGAPFIGWTTSVDVVVRLRVGWSTMFIRTTNKKVVWITAGR